MMNRFGNESWDKLVAIWDLGRLSGLNGMSHRATVVGSLLQMITFIDKRHYR